MSETITNGSGDTLYVVTMWSPLALDHVVANVWAANRYRAFTEAHASYPATSTVVEMRLGTAADLD